MEAEPPKAEPPKRKRRWFQFSLRMLLIGVTLLAGVWRLRQWNRFCCEGVCQSWKEFLCADQL
jgi:hypothetical protein